MSNTQSITPTAKNKITPESLWVIDTIEVTGKLMVEKSKLTGLFLFTTHSPYGALTSQKRVVKNAV